MKIVTERLTERDIEMARVYLRRVLEHPSVVESLVNGLVVKATLRSFGSLRPGAHEASTEGEDALRASRIETLARELKARRNPSNFVANEIMPVVANELADNSDAGSRRQFSIALEALAFRDVAEVEAEKIVAPISAALRRIGL